MLEVNKSTITRFIHKQYTNHSRTIRRDTYLHTLSASQNKPSYKHPKTVTNINTHNLNETQTPNRQTSKKTPLSKKYCSKNRKSSHFPVRKTYMILLVAYTILQQKTLLEYKFQPRIL